MSKSMDAAFVPFSYSGFSPSMAINGDTSNRIKSYVKVADIAEGMPVAKFGKRTGKTTGKILNPSISVSTGLTRQVLSSCVSNQGDSGGPVYLNSNYAGYSKNAIISITHAISTDRYNYNVSTRAGYVLATFNLNLYTG